MSTENLEGISNGHGNIAYTWREPEVPRPERRSSERGGQRLLELAEICTADDARSRRLSVSDAVTDRYREMEKRVEEQDRTIAELKGIIENLQDIVYRQKLDKEAETLVL